MRPVVFVTPVSGAASAIEATARTLDALPPPAGARCVRATDGALVLDRGRLIVEADDPDFVVFAVERQGYGANAEKGEASEPERVARARSEREGQALGGVRERYRFHPEGAAFGVALGEGPAGLPYWRDLRPDPARPLAQWEPAADWCPYAPDESAAELAQELMRVAGLVREVEVIEIDEHGKVAPVFSERPALPHRIVPSLEVVCPPPTDPQARALGAALGALDEALGREEKK